MTTNFKKFYTDEKVVKGKYVDNLGHNLFSDGIYRTKLTEKDLPDSFVKWTSWYSRFVDMKNVMFVVYKSNPMIGNNTIKYDTFYISYNNKIELDEDENPTFDSFDYAISAVYGKDIIEKLRKYSPWVENLDEIEEMYNKRIEETTKAREEEMKSMGFVKSENGFGWEKKEETDG